MKEKISTLLLALVLLALASCAPVSTEKEDSTKQPDPPDALETETSDFPETLTVPVNIPDTVRFDSKLGCSLAYDPIFFEAEDVEDEYLKSQSIEPVICLAVQSIWENNGFPVLVTVTPLDASSIEEAINDEYGLLDLDAPVEETTFGEDSRYSGTHLTYHTHTSYAVNESYVTEQNGTVFEVQVSSYYQPSEELLAHAYAVVDSIAF